jgi:molybdopterin-containing oxidoreductase family membrane subunit
MSELTYNEINDGVLSPLRPPRRAYWVALVLLFAGIGAALTAWIIQVQLGMGVTGLSKPVGWAVYITNFVFWVGIAHSGTLISAILHLVRSRWRTAVSRSAEAMTVFAVMTAGLFPMVHLGRVWVFYYIIPYPSERQLWPDFLSPLIWDVCAVGTYFIVSSIFWYVGLIPDLAAARDRFGASHGAGHWRARLYRRRSLGWCGAASQWRHYGRAYLFFAALATPLVVSVHSVVSWDFAMSILPGWHTTIFAPYFVAGAIHSGLAMVLTLVIPMRQFALFRETGWIAPLYWALPLLNVLVPILFVFRKVRRNLKALFAISILVNIGMWLERLVIITGSPSHDFLPHNWLSYAPRPVEITITIGALAFFLFWFFGFTKLAPTVALSDVKEDLLRGRRRAMEAGEADGAESARRDAPRLARSAPGVLAIFREAEALLAAIRRAKKAGFGRIEAYSPMRLEAVEDALGRRTSPVRYWTLIGAVSGCIGGFALAIGSALVNGLMAGGKHPVSIIPYCIVGFEGTILCGTLANLAGVLWHARLGRPTLPAGYDERFSRDRFGLLVACGLHEADAVRSALAPCGAEDMRVV